MRLRWQQTYVEWGLVALLAGLCTILSALQYRWTGEVSRVEAEHLRAGVSGEAQQFCRAFDFSLSESCNTLTPHGETLTDRTRETIHVQHFQLWKPIRPRPFFSRLAVAVPSPDSLQLYEQSQSDGRLRPMIWPADWRRLQESLNIKDNGGSAPTGNTAGTLFEFPVFDTLSTTNTPVVASEQFPGNDLDSENEWMIFELDTNYFRNVWLPELAEIYLNPAEQPLYDIVVKTVSTPPRVIYSSRPEALKNNGPAVVMPLNREGRTIENQHGPGPDYCWVLEVRAYPGALESVVNASHRRNLAVAILLNGLIFAAGFALVRYTRYSRRLAEAQMNFVANVSHELRTPLTVIRGAAHNMQRGVVHERSQIEQYSGLIMHHAEQLGDMVEQVLALAGARKGKSAPLRQPVALAGMLKDALSTTANDIQAADCEVSLDLPPVLPVISGDAFALRRVFQNLITNAAKHGGGGKWIGIKAFIDKTVQPPMVEVQVADRGARIPVDEQAEIFKPFYRSTRAQADQIRGSGLGLGLVKEIVEAHGGTVSVRSTEGQGATFSVRLPVKKPNKSK